MGGTRKVVLTFVFRHPLILALGVGLIVLALYLTWRKHSLLLSGHLSDGVVVELVSHRGSKGGTIYNPRIAYTRADGTRAEFVSSFGSNTPMHDPGEKVRVVYYPGARSPDILAFPDTFLFPWVCFCAGVFVLMMCAGFIFGPGVINATYLPKLENPVPLKARNMLK